VQLKGRHFKVSVVYIISVVASKCRVVVPTETTLVFSPSLAGSSFVVPTFRSHVTIQFKIAFKDEEDQIISRLGLSYHSLEMRLTEGGREYPGEKLADVCEGTSPSSKALHVSASWPLRTLDMMSCCVWIVTWRQLVLQGSLAFVFNQDECFFDGSQLSCLILYLKLDGD
jgi:hypothetical protein